MRGGYSLPFYHLPFCHSVILPFCHSAILPFYVILSFCHLFSSKISIMDWELEFNTNQKFCKFCSLYHLQLRVFFSMTEMADGRDGADGSGRWKKRIKEDNNFWLHNVGNN